MFARKFRKVTAAASVLATLAAGPGQASACCFWKSATTAYYAPAPVVVPACNTCNYAPQVAYRTVYTNVPVTSYRPITSVNPCTGCPTTVMQPVTAYRLQPTLVPYTAYQPCCAAPVTVGYAPACPTCPTGGCATGACGMAPAATAYYAPAATVAPALPAAPAAPCCGNASAAVAPQTSSYASAAPMYASPSYAAGGSTTYSQTTSSTIAPSIGPTTTVPSTSPATGPALPGSQSAPSTFRQDQPADDGPGSPSFKPIPDPSAASAPRRNMIIPRKSDTDDLTVSKGMPGGGVIRTASAKVAIPASTTVDDGGWHDAR